MEGIFSSRTEVVKKINECMLFLAVLKVHCTKQKLGFQSWEISDCRGTSYTLRFQIILDSSRAQGGLVLLVNLLEVTYFLKVIS